MPRPSIATIQKTLRAVITPEMQFTPIRHFIRPGNHRSWPLKHSEKLRVPWTQTSPLVKLQSTNPFVVKHCSIAVLKAWSLISFFGSGLESRHESNQIFILRYPLFSPVFDQPPKINPIVGLRKIVYKGKHDPITGCHGFVSCTSRLGGRSVKRPPALPLLAPSRSLADYRCYGTLYSILIHIRAKRRCAIAIKRGKVSANVIQRCLT